MSSPQILERVRVFACRHAPRYVVTLTGLALAGLAIFADRLGIDPNREWGPSRTALLRLGILVFSLAQVPAFVRFVLSKTRTTVASPSEGAPGGHPSAADNVSPDPTLRTRHSEQSQPFDDLIAPRRITRPRLDAALTFGVVLAVEALYVWFASVGYWTDWPKTTAYYDLLADSFLHGKTALLVEPDPRLALLPNPYSYEAREFIPQLWDASYYRGKYYLYWGPAPAAIIGLVRLAGVPEVGDNEVVFVAASVELISLALILLNLWKRFGAHLPTWLLPLSLVVAGTAHPILWVLNRPAIHEAAIASGQAFLMAGLFFALPGLEGRDVRPARLLLAGVMWSLAFGSRIVVAVPIAVLAAAFVYMRFRGLGGSAPGLRKGLVAAPLILPMAAAVLLYGLYNMDRFGNPLELGWRYHLSGRGDYSQPGTPVLDLAYVLPNLYNYAARGMRTLTVFPFVKPIWGRGSLAPLPIEIPKPYYTEQVTGLALALPFVIFGGFLARWLVCSDCRQIGPVDGVPRTSRPGGSERALRILASTIGVASLLGTIPLLLFVISSQRFLLDLTPLLVLLSIAGAWVAHRVYSQNRALRISVSTLIVVLALAGVLVGSLLAVTGFEARFEHLNPGLFDRITRLLAF